MCCPQLVIVKVWEGCFAFASGHSSASELAFPLDPLAWFIHLPLRVSLSMLYFPLLCPQCSVLLQCVLTNLCFFLTSKAPDFCHLKMRLQGCRTVFVVLCSCNYSHSSWCPVLCVPGCSSPGPCHLRGHCRHQLCLL